MVRGNNKKRTSQRAGKERQRRQGDRQLRHALVEAIVLSAPEATYFDNIKIKSGQPTIRFVVPYQTIDIESQARFGPGDHNIVIKNNGRNTTTNRPLIKIEE